MTITAAADGSALGNPGPAGWAWYVDDAHWQAGGWKHATNNMGELKAVLELFRATAHLDDDLLVLCDSQYVINTVTKWMRGWKAKGWRKGDGKPVMNLEIIQELDEVMAGRRYRFEWVRGHAGHPMNEAADARARAVSEAFQAGRPIPHGPGWPREDVETDAVAGVSQAASASRPLAEIPEPEIPDAEIAGAPDDTLAPDSELALFSLDDPDLHEVTLWLTDDEHIRLHERARQEGVSAEELLRGLI
ncbi:RNase H family protein [Mycetocola sp. 2940]|uniref:RNase H family protein n=1 Tax=Mycetocola sp. 2940 TaxID=3156452 RepID=UPI0033926236